MIYLITFIYILLKAGFDTYRIKKTWGKKNNIKHYWIDIITGMGWLVVWIWGEATFLDVSLFYVFYSLGFSPLLNLFRVKFLSHILGEKYSHSWGITNYYRWGDVFTHRYYMYVVTGYQTHIQSKTLAILCYRSRAWYDRLHEIIFPGSDLRLRWVIDLALLGILIYLRS